ncbi:uncharacterized protein LOC143598356 [Bidens hawaiensis]|uniref:uncharacterized protein LOC143598356 n=1 Tax=Bidens hawaiensis TaxID=980011 RepID=UPI00404A5650
MKGIYPGQILTAVGVDSNNADDLDLTVESNFTFMSDRQKGLIPAIQKVFPNVEHRYCVRHIEENMKQKWKGQAAKNLALSDLQLNNMCEVFNRQLTPGRDLPIISCLEYIREYLMKRIMKVHMKIAKCKGLLTPNVTVSFKKIKKDATKCNVIWNGATKYQVSGPNQEQYVVTVDQRSCTCRMWDLTGIPCKHAVACIFDMGEHGLEDDPINGQEEWAPSPWPTTLTAPKHHVQIGRPKKNRKKSAVEIEELSQKVGKAKKLPRKGRTVTCDICKQPGHNKRSCNKRKTGETGEAGGSGTQVDATDAAGGSEV